MATAPAKVRADLLYYEQVVDGEEVIYVRDPVRGTYIKYNELQVAMLKKLDGNHSPAQIAAELSIAFEVEIEPEAAERFVTRARELMLLDINSYDVTPQLAQREVTKALRKSGFRPRKEDPNKPARALTPEAFVFAEALRQIELKHPRAATGHLAEVLRLNPQNRRAKQLYDLIQTAYIKASGGLADFPMFVLFNPKRFLKFLSRTLGRFLFSWWGVLGLFLYYLVGAHSYSLVSFDAKIGPFDAAVAFIAYTLGGLFHELGHGFACQHYGGDVEEIGFMMFYYLRPSAYCDTTSSYIIHKRHDKVVIQLAGVIASMVWCSTSAIFLALLNPSLPIYPGLAIDLLIEVTFSFVTLVPLLKLDGYYAICDYFNFPNLRDRSFKVTRAWLSRLLFGLNTKTETVTLRVRDWMIAYGIAAFLFTMGFIYLAYSSLLIWLVEHGRVMGLIAAVLLTLYLGSKIVLRPLFRGIATLVRERKRIFTLRRTPVLVLLASALIVPWFVKWPVLVDAEFEIVPVSKAEVRAQVPGRLEEIYVVEGQHVTAGQAVAKLRDVELSTRVAVLEAKLEAAQQHAAQLRAGARTEEIAVARSHAAHEAAVVYDDAATAERARVLAKARLGTQSAADLARGREAKAAGTANAATAALALVENGPRAEEIRIAEADTATLMVELEHNRNDEERMLLRSPIDGTVVTKHLKGKLQTVLAAGDLVVEIHDQRSIIGEINLPPATPFDEIAIGNRARLRARAMPDEGIDTHVERIRQVVQKAGQATTVMTAPFTLEHPVSGLSGHARIYGEKRSLAYAVIYLPLRRLIGVQLWSL